MSKAKVLSRILGYCVLEIPRGFYEDFLNLCLRYGFAYYKIALDEEKGRMRVFVPASQKNNILTACRIWQIRVKAVSKHGLPVRLGNLRGRWGLLIGAILSVALFILSQSVLWRIDVIGNERLSKEHVIECLAEHGMSVGDFTSRINYNSVEQKVMINDDDIAWIAINIIGTVARVEIRETIETEIKEKNDRPANVVSLYDGQIVSLEVYSGFMSVKEGDFVRAGELLVSGIYKEGKAPLRYSRANARVLARVVRTFEVEIPLLQEKKVPTGEKISKKSLIFFGNSIKLFLNYRNLPPTCDIINYLYTLDPFSLGELPIALSVQEYYPYEMVEVEISEAEAIELAYEKLGVLIDEQLPEAQILKKSLYGEIVDDKYVLRCTVNAICNVAKQVEFEVLN